jgi:transcriptional regulator with XRE-family HTH domain
LTPAGLRECLGRLGLSTADLAVRAKVSRVTARRWLSGRQAIPDDVARFVSILTKIAGMGLPIELPAPPPPVRKQFGFWRSVLTFW